MSLLLFLLGYACGEPSAMGNPLGDFFQKVGRSVSKTVNGPTPKPTPRKARRSTSVQEETENTGTSPNPSSPIPSATVTPTPLDIRAATSAPPDREGPRDLPYGVAVPNHPGLVTSPYAPHQGYVDVRAFPKSAEVMDPFTGKVFLIP
ncbi:MAG: hypothetical protein ACR2G0_06410 [Chthoniobacterales bacterium]